VGFQTRVSFRPWTELAQTQTPCLLRPWSESGLPETQFE